jgi:hypothetical protein
MKYLKRSIGFFIILNIFMGCSPSDLRSPEIKKKSFTAGDKISVISTLNSFLPNGSRPQDWKEKTKWKLILTDTWSSSLLRRFTILTTNSQKMQLEIEKNGNLRLEILSGENIYKVYRIEGKNVFYGNGNVPVKDSTAKLYIESLAMYVRLPMIIPDFSILLAAEEKSLFSVFATNGTLEPTSLENQFVYVFNKEKKELDHIQFTYREVYQSYKGFLKYSETKEKGGFKYPTKIQIKETLEEQASVHEIKILDFFIGE